MKIEDIAELGPELDESSLRFVAGGRPPVDKSSAVYDETNGYCTWDADF